MCRYTWGWGEAYWNMSGDRRVNLGQRRALINVKALCSS